MRGNHGNTLKSHDFKLGWLALSQTCLHLHQVGPPSQFLGGTGEVPSPSGHLRPFRWVTRLKRSSYEKKKKKKMMMMMMMKMKIPFALQRRLRSPPPVTSEPPSWGLAWHAAGGLGRPLFGGRLMLVPIRSKLSNPEPAVEVYCQGGVARIHRSVRRTS